MHCFLLFTLLTTLRLGLVKVKAIAIDSGSLEIRDNLVNNGDLFTDFEDLSPSSDDSSLWNDGSDLASVPGCNGPQSSLDSGNLFDSEDLLSSSNIKDNGPLFGRGLEDFSTRLENFAAPLKTLSSPACVNQDFQFRTPPKGNTNTEEHGQSTDQTDQNQNQEPQAPLDDLLIPLQIELSPKCPQDPEYGYVEDVCCPTGPSGLRNLIWQDCVRCKFLNCYTRPSASDCLYH